MEMHSCSHWCFGHVTPTCQRGRWWWSCVESGPVLLLCRLSLGCQERGRARCLLVVPIMAETFVAGWFWCTQTPLWGPQHCLDLLCPPCQRPSPRPRPERPRWAWRAAWGSGFCWGSGSCGGGWEMAQERSRWSGSWLSRGWVERRGSRTGGPSTGSCPGGAALPTARPAPRRPEGGGCGGSGGLWDGTSPGGGGGGGADAACRRRRCGWMWMEPRLIQWGMMMHDRDRVGIRSVQPGPEQEDKKTMRI